MSLLSYLVKKRSLSVVKKFIKNWHYCFSNIKFDKHDKESIRMSLVTHEKIPQRYY
jgi:hypothetical protein